jgi:hypothetical protein
MWILLVATIFTLLGLLWSQGRAGLLNAPPPPPGERPPAAPDAG